MSPKISVLMSTYKEPISYIDQAIDSILNQSYSNFEFIICIDCPSNTALINEVKKYAELDSRIRIVINPSNLGLVGSLNNGLKYCTGDFVARMDADDISNEYRLEKELEFIEKNDYDFISSNYTIFYDDSEKEIMITYPEEDKNCRKLLEDFNCFCHPSWLAKKEVYSTLDGYRDIDFCEDYDFVVRAVLNGFKIGICQDNLLRYRFNYDGISRMNTIKQNLISEFISSYYRIGKIISLEEYDNFLKSKYYQTSLNKFCKLQEIKNKYKTTDNFWVKFKCLLTLLVSLDFWKQRAKTRRIVKRR